MTREPGWKGKILLGGLLLLCLTPVGWVMALGFRSMTGKRLTTGVMPAMPPWRGSLGEVLLRGLKSSGVILSYLAPSIVVFMLLGAASIRVLVRQGSEVGLALLAAIVFPPAGIPALPVIAWWRWPWFSLTPVDVAVVSISALSAIALRPSAFLRVAATGRYSAAFQVRTAVVFVARNRAAYTEAWALSLCVSAGAVLVVPLMPWLLFWSYLAILHAFLQVLWLSESA